MYLGTHTKPAYLGVSFSDLTFTLYQIFCSTLHMHHLVLGTTHQVSASLPISQKGKLRPSKLNGFPKVFQENSNPSLPSS